MSGRSITSKHPGYPAQLQAAGRQLGIASQLAEELLQARWIALLKRIGRDEATKLLSLTQALDAALIQRYETSWDWELLSRSKALPWSLELIERFEDRWNWSKLSANEALPWSLELIEFTLLTVMMPPVGVTNCVSVISARRPARSISSDQTSMLPHAGPHTTLHP